ncbi:MAG: FUSC family protein [Clostridium sp.]
MDRKTIVSKTALFVVIVVAVILFKQVFGDENTLVGVTIITASLMFMERDLTTDFLGYFILFAVINLGQGLLAFFTGVNPVIGVLLTFIAMFTTGYLFTYNMKKPMYVAFGLQYLFMVYSPVTYEQLPIRLLALLFGAAFMMALQLVANKNRLEKAAKEIVPRIVSSLGNKINLVIQDNYNGELEEEITTSIVALSNCVQENRQDYFHITVEGKVNFNISIAMERINILVNRIYEDYKVKNTLSSTGYTDVLNSIGDIVSNTTADRDRVDKINDQIDRINGFIEKYELIFRSNNIECGVSRENIRELLENMDFLKTSLEDVLKFEGKEYKKFVKRIEIPKGFTFKEMLKRDFNGKSIKFSYALRSALFISIAVGLAGYFNLPEGKWLAFTLLAIIQPYKQDADNKSKSRVYGTIIGVVVFVVLFALVKDTTIRSLLIMLSGYISSFQTRYSRQTIFITFSALASASLIGGSGVELVVNRVFYVFAGTAVAMLANKFILPYGIDDSTKYLMDTYDKIIDQIKKEINSASEGSGSIEIVRALVMKVNVIEGRVRSNLSVEDSGTYQEHEKIKDILRRNRIEINDLYDEYLGAYTKPKYTN